MWQTAYGLGRLAFRAASYHPYLKYAAGAYALYKGMTYRRDFRGNMNRRWPQMRQRRYFPRKPVYARGARRGPRVTYQTATKGYYQSTGFRTRKLGSRRWRNVLWRDTQSNTHYRSHWAITALYMVPVNTMDTALVNCEPMVSTLFGNTVEADPFWLGTGGLQPHETGKPLALFGDNDIILRGGIASLVFAPATTSLIPLKVRLWVVRTNPIIDPAIILAIQGVAKGVNWDPTLVPEFRQDFGKIIFSKEILLEPGAQPTQIKWRQQVQKIDQATWQGSTGPPVVPGANKLYWMWMVIPNSVQATPTSEPLYIQKGYNVSFSSDSI